MRSITYVKDSGVPILGINAGRLGFLTSVQKENIGEAVNKIKDNKFSIIDRTLLEVKSYSASKLFSYALNEVTIQRKDTTSLLNISCSINGNYLTNYWSDGLIISTPTGSTGYSLSNGGSVVSPESKVIILNPIAPHNINMRSLIIPDDSEVKFKLKELIILIYLWILECIRLNQEMKFRYQNQNSLLRQLNLMRITFIKG